MRVNMLQGDQLSWVREMGIFHQRCLVTPLLLQQYKLAQWLLIQFFEQVRHQTSRFQEMLGHVLSDMCSINGKKLFSIVSNYITEAIQKVIDFVAQNRKQMSTLAPIISQFKAGLFDLENSFRQGQSKINNITLEIKNIQEQKTRFSSGYKVAEEKYLQQVLSECRHTLNRPQNMILNATKENQLRYLKLRIQNNKQHIQELRKKQLNCVVQMNQKLDRYDIRIGETISLLSQDWRARVKAGSKTQQYDEHSQPKNGKKVQPNFKKSQNTNRKDFPQFTQIMRNESTPEQYQNEIIPKGRLSTIKQFNESQSEEKSKIISQAKRNCLRQDNSKVDLQSLQNVLNHGILAVSKISRDSRVSNSQQVQYQRLTNNNREK